MSDATSETEAAIRDLLEQRRVIWNSRDATAYRALLTDDVVIVSATGRASCGVDEAIRLYLDQKQQPSYRDAVITATIVHKVTLRDTATAQVDASYRMTGVCIPPDTPPRAVDGDLVFTVRQDCGVWKIAALHARPPQQL